MSLMPQDLLSILAQDKNAGVAAVASKAASYQRDVERLKPLIESEPDGDWQGIVFAYAIVARELKFVAQELKHGTPA